MGFILIREIRKGQYMYFPVFCLFFQTVRGQTRCKDIFLHSDQAGQAYSGSLPDIYKFLGDLYPGSVYI